MKPISTGTISGCVVWFIVFTLMSTCLVPAGMMVGSFTSVTDFALQTLEPLICPDGTTSKFRTYATTTTDHRPSTAYVMQCVDANGNVVKEDPVTYAFIWIGIVTGISLILAGVLSFALAAPAAVLLARMFRRKARGMMAENIEPR